MRIHIILFLEDLLQLTLPAPAEQIGVVPVVDEHQLIVGKGLEDDHRLYAEQQRPLQRRLTRLGPVEKVVWR